MGNTVTEQTSKPAGNFKEGDWWGSDNSPDGYACQVLAVHPYSNDDGAMVAVTYADRDRVPVIEHVSAGKALTVASDAEIDEAKAVDERLRTSHGLGSFSALILRYPLPLSRHGHATGIDIQVPTLDALTEVAKTLGLPVENPYGNRYEVQWPPGQKAWEPGLLVTWSAHVPKPKPAEQTGEAEA